jgi:CPA2 family monovalent cation:H+ antiporter-2
MDGLAPNGQYFLGVILYIIHHNYSEPSDELGVKSQKFAGIVIGSLIVQDIVAILMMVLLSTVAASQQFSEWNYCNLY